MAKAAKTQYQCQQCGARAPKWAGQCGDCGAWNSLLEVRTADPRGRAGGYSGKQAPVRALDEIPLEKTPRTPSGLTEFDRVMGGGLVPGSVVLVGGDPGIGKSTLLLQVLARLAAERRLKCLYVSGEESGEQIALRAHRLGVQGNLRVLTETNVDDVVATARAERPEVVVIDSIQTMYSTDLGSAPGGVAQVRDCAARLVQLAKDRGPVVFLVGHVTKEGTLAGPRVLEHMVDTVLHFEGDGGTRFRLVRAVKNRFGAVNELGVFAMTDTGLKEITNPSAIFLSRVRDDVPGSVILVNREGTRPMLVEVQALVDSAPGANPRRVAVGLDPNRVAMLLAILHRHGGIASHDQDVFVNVVGGVRVVETAADLAVALAVASSLRGAPLPADMIVFGEIGLAGEVRPVPNGPERLREAAKHGFRRAVLPQGNAPKEGVQGLELYQVTSLSEALQRVRES